MTTNGTSIGQLINLPEPPLYPTDQTGWSYDQSLMSDHPGGAFIVMCDGSVQFILEGIDAGIMYAFATRDDHEIIPSGVLSQ